jgi:hypothetical protein
MVVLPISTAQRTADFSLIHITLFFWTAPRHVTKFVALNVVLAWRCLPSGKKRIRLSIWEHRGP